MKLVNDNFEKAPRRKVLETKTLDGLESIEETKVYYSFGTLVSQEKKRLSSTSTNSKKFTESTYGQSIRFNNESLLKNPNVLLSTVEVEVTESDYNNDLYQTLEFDYNSSKVADENNEKNVNMSVFKKFMDLRIAELKKYPFLDCKETISVPDENVKSSINGIADDVILNFNAEPFGSFFIELSGMVALPSKNKGNTPKPYQNELNEV